MKYGGVFSLVILLVVLNGCASPTTESPQISGTKTATASEGDIRLNPEQVNTNGIQAVEVVERNVAPVIVALARVRTRAGGEAEVFSPFPGRLVGESTFPRIGDFVTKGQHIADVEQQFMASEKLQFDTTAVQLEAQVQQAQQEVDLRRTELSRAQQLYEGGAIPQKQLQSAEFEVRQAAAKLEGTRRAKEKYDAAQSKVNSEPRRASIVAPISGTVVAAAATLGQQIEPAKSLLTIADLSTVWVEAAVHERDLSRVRGVREAEIAIPGSEDRPFNGRVVTIGNLVDPQNRTVPVIFSVSNPGTVLKIEMYVEARIPIGPPAKALLIPSSAVLSEENRYSVYAESEPGVYRRKTIHLGQRDAGMIVVASGLDKGEKVVSVGADTLRSESLKGEIPAEEGERKRP